MGDAFDRAQQLEEQHRKAALKRARANSTAASQASYSQTMAQDGRRYCLDCDIEINTNRLLAAPHTLRCIDCQEDFDKRQARR
ncbi:TraR/DksA C4-type zinc finger protein [Thalassotalea euphylliae]|uniref:TraR/DksA family transcriptional regulator n=1 Tax=Thalassotalea euphylliae TaxID=1655234 RepID=A0A3E0U718_9GAMM|nr:TraR/DksA C4-type zinc finger protein [Thalassotalea euphylliae]REL32524.1 TraR/DksA family transcriptional regulator [Thalassotalea euphylliae]